MAPKPTARPQKTIVFTRHNGFEDDTTSASPLWAEIHYALKGDPALHSTGAMCTTALCTPTHYDP
ncbi:MAG: hypothetical protein R2793_07070 [Flavobacteriaceae bacterium]